jgi:hypothetical protein
MIKTKKIKKKCAGETKEKKPCGREVFTDYCWQHTHVRATTPVRATTHVRATTPDIKESKTGLKLSRDIIYKRISGPISVTYFETINGKHGILFFGDQHGPSKNMCEPCNNSNDCTLLYSDEFLTRLNILSTPSKKVSFFLNIEIYQDLNMQLR